ncbi:MAG TPA: aldose 1-epimerase family protein [Planctomycetaceae bacterium]
MAIKRWILSEAGKGSEKPDFSLSAAELGLAGQDFHVRLTRLRGGLQEGVECVEIDNGRFSFVVLPTRGMSIWKGWLGKRGAKGSVEIGWQSPVEGPVHPHFVSVAEPGGLGFLDGFDEWFVRCGLESNGAPDFDEHGTLKYTLHGRIANLPASRVELTFDDEKKELALTGIVDETRFHFHKLRLQATISTRLGEPGLRVHDEVINLAATPATAQMLYHINFGPPLLEAGSKIVAPIAQLVPRTPHAAKTVATWDTFKGPEPGFDEEVYLTQLVAGADQRTEVLLENAAKSLGASVNYDQKTLPYFILWKDTRALSDGYVMGMEPSTNYPNPRTYETKQDRVVKLGAGEKVAFDLAITIHGDRQSVAAAEKRIATIAGATTPHVARAPQKGWSIEGEE